jgi:hypothetical protein
MPELDKKALASAEKELIDSLADYGQLQNFNAHAPGRIARDIISNYLSALPEQEPVAEIVSAHGDPEAFGERELIARADIQKFPYGTKLFASSTALQPDRPDTEKEGN